MKVSIAKADAGVCLTTTLPKLTKKSSHFSHMLAHRLLSSQYTIRGSDKSQIAFFTHRQGLTFEIIYHMPYIPQGSLDASLADAKYSLIQCTETLIRFLSLHMLLLFTKYVLCHLMMLSDAVFLTLSQISDLSVCIHSCLSAV